MSQDQSFFPSATLRCPTNELSLPSSSSRSHHPHCTQCFQKRMRIVSQIYTNSSTNEQLIMMMNSKQTERLDAAAPMANSGVSGVTAKVSLVPLATVEKVVQLQVAQSCHCRLEASIVIQSYLDRHISYYICVSLIL